VILLIVVIKQRTGTITRLSSY